MIGTERVEVRRRLPAPIDEVFRWWTDPRLLERWMTPVGEVEAEVDLRVGGRLRIVMRDGPVEIEHLGQFVEIDRPRRVAFTWQSRFTAGPSLVTVDLEAEDDTSTRVLIVHSQLPPEAARTHGGGWGAMLARLERELSAA
jgi:uncharacterized protein YndB with AHSA1/START domain